MSEEERRTSSLEVENICNVNDADTAVIVAVGQSPLHDLLHNFNQSSTSELNDICKQYLMSHAINRDMIYCLLTNEDYTDGWELTKIQLKVWQEYIFWYYVIFVIEDTHELSFKIHLPVILSNLNFFDVSNISAFIRKIRNKIKFVVKKRSADAARELAVGVVIKDVGPLCEKENISLEWLHNPTPLKKHVHVTKGLVLELRRVRMRHNLNLKKASLWIKYLCELDYTPDADGLKRQLDRMYNKQSSLLRSLKDKGQAGYEYVNETYQPPQIKFVPDRDTVSCNQVDHKVETSSEVNKIKFVPDRDTVSCNRVDHKVETSSEVNKIKFVPDRDTVSCNRVDHKVETSSEVNKIKFVPDRDTVSCNRVDHKVETSSEVTKIKFVPDRDTVSCNRVDHKVETSSEVNKIKVDKDSLRKLKIKLQNTREEKLSSNLRLYKLRKEYNLLKTKHEISESKLSTLSSTRNVNKKLKRKENKINELVSSNNKLEKEKKFLKARNIAIKNKFKSQSALLKYYRNKMNDSKLLKNVEIHSSKNNSLDHNNSNTCAINDHLNYLENENEIMKDQVEELMNSSSETIKLFEGGKYKDNVREVYLALLSMNVGVKNVEKIVQTVLEKMASIKVDRLPKKTFSETMLIEAKILAQLQATEAMLDSSNNTLHTDGTKRGGREFGGLQIGTNSGQYRLGLTEMVRGDTESFLDMINTILIDMAKLAQTDANTQTQKRNQLLLSIKNTMTDRHIVNTCLKTSLEKLKSECIPETDDTTEEIKNKISTLNGFKCNLHVLVNFATQAEAGLKIWEQNVLDFNVNENSSTSNKFTYNQCTTDFIRACTKLCVPGADEKSGYGSFFLTFLQDLDIPCDIKMTTFHGHRINLMFAMGAAVFFHRFHIENFINSFFCSGERNLLVSAVCNYLNNPVYLAGCRAFGIIDKLFTGPIWRIIEATNHILDLNDEWFNFKQNVEKFSSDASALVDGKIIYPEFTNKDLVFDSLFSVQDPELNSLTIEALQIILLNLSIIIERQLYDILPGGHLNENTEGVDGPQLRKESKTVHPTNIISERDFANFDRLTREKPNANIVALEGLILFSNNKTVNWLNEMECEKKTEIIKIARENAPSILQQFKIRKEQIKQKHILLLKQRKEEKVKKEKAKQQELEQLTKDIEKIGGLWVSNQDFNKNLQKLNESLKFDAVKTQLKFRKKVLKCRPDDKTLLQFSVNGIPFTFDELISNLHVLISSSNVNDHELQQFSIDSNFSIKANFVIKSKSEREALVLKQRELVNKKIENIRSKLTANVTSEPLAKKPKKATNQSIDIEPSEILNDNSNTVIEYKIGQNVAVAYMDAWYPGQIVFVNVDDNVLTVKFLHPAKSNVFKWPEKEDTSIIDKIFVFHFGFDILPKDSFGRTWYIPYLQEIQSEYQAYFSKYFE